MLEGSAHALNVQRVKCPTSLVDRSAFFRFVVYMRCRLVSRLFLFLIVSWELFGRYEQSQEHSQS